MGDFSHLTMTPVAGPLPETSLWHTVSSYRPEESTFNPTQLKITQLRYQITSQLIPSMYGGILSMNYQNLSLKDNGLMLHLPGSYELQIKSGLFLGNKRGSKMYLNLLGCFEI